MCAAAGDLQLGVRDLLVVICKSRGQVSLAKLVGAPAANNAHAGSELRARGAGVLVARVDVAHLEAERFLHVRLATVVAAPADWEWHGLQVVQFGVPDLLADECAGVQQAGGDLGGLELGAVVARRHDLGHVSLAVEVEAPALQLQRQVHAAVEVPARLDAPGVLPHAGRQRQLPPVRAAPATHRAAVHAAGVPAARGDVVGLVAQFGRHERAHAPAH